MGQKTDPHGIRCGGVKDWDSKWISEDGLYISDDIIHHSMQDRKIHLKKLFGKKKYKKMVKSLSK